MTHQQNEQEPTLPRLSLEAFAQREKQYRELYGKVDFRDLLRQISISFDLSDIPRSLLAELLVPQNGMFEFNLKALQNLYTVFYQYLKEKHDPESIEILAYFLTPYLPALSRFLHEHIEADNDSAMTEDYRAILQALSVAVDAGLAYSRLRVNDVHRAMLERCVDERWLSSADRPPRVKHG